MNSQNQEQRRCFSEGSLDCGQENPFSLSFGKQPESWIPREEISDFLINNLEQYHPSWQVCMISGPYGSGKTCLMRQIYGYFSQKDEWTAVNLSAQQDILFDLVQMLSPNLPNQDLIPSGWNKTVLLHQMMETISENEKKILIMVDDAVNNESMREFVSLMQICIRENMPVFVFISGVHENLKALKDDQFLTFLYRAWPAAMTSLSLQSISREYMRIFNIPMDQANAMAKETGGYAFAYQLLGYLCFEECCSYEEVLDEYDEKLAGSVYEKIWEESSDQDRKVLMAVHTAGDSEMDLRQKLEMNGNVFAQYRRRLTDRGILRKNEHGTVEFALPRFGKFLEIQGILEDPE